MRESAQNRPAMYTALVFAAATLAYIALRNSNVVVSGAPRAFEVYARQRMFLHTNEHLLYPVNIYLWTRTLSAVGFAAATPTGFYALAEALNAAAAAGSVAIVYLLCVTLTQRAGLSLLISTGFALSRAFLTHATCASEPTVGLFWSLVSALLVGISLTGKNRWLASVAGFVLILAMGSYQSMVLAGPALAALIWLWPDGENPDRRRFASRAWACAPFLLGCCVGFVLIYGGAYYLSGTRGLAAIVERFVHVPAEQIYGGFSPVKLVAFPLGFTYALLPCLPLSCTGFRCLADPALRHWIPVVLLSGAFVGGFAGLLVLMTRWLWPRLSALDRVVLASCGIGLLFDGAALIYWMPTYDKLWLQPLAFLSVAASIVAKAALANSEGPQSWNRIFLSTGFGLVALVAVSNISIAAYKRVTPVPYLSEAELVANMVGQKDLLVGDWNAILILHQYIWVQRDNVFNVPTRAIYDGRATVDRLQERITQTEQAGGKVFFLGILDLPKSQWTPVVGDYGPRYGEFDRFRTSSEPVASFESDEGPITLRLLNQPKGDGATATSSCAPTATAE
jgi:hypothetical protein